LKGNINMNKEEVDFFVDFKSTLTKDQITSIRADKVSAIKSCPNSQTLVFCVTGQPLCVDQNGKEIKKAINKKLNELYIDKK